MSTQILADALQLADTGAFRNAAAMRTVLVFVSSNATMVDWLIQEPEMRACLDARCVAAERISVNECFPLKMAARAR